MSYGDFPPPPQGPSSYTEAPGAGPAFQLSSWGRRAGASIVDALIVIATYIVFLILSLILGSISEGLGIAVGVIGYIVVVGFSIWQIVRQGQTGQTIGKQQIGISVVRESDARVQGPLMAIVRQIAHTVDSFICMIGYLFPLWDAKRQTLADKIVGTVVVDTPKR